MFVILRDVEEEEKEDRASFGPRRCRAYAA